MLDKTFISFESKLPKSVKPILEKLDNASIATHYKNVILSDIGELFNYQEDGRAAHGYLLYIEQRVDKGFYAT